MIRAERTDCGLLAYRKPMLRAVLPVLLALTVGGTPIAREICLVVCAEQPSLPSAHTHHAMGAHAAHAAAIPARHHHAESDALEASARGTGSAPGISAMPACCERVNEPQPAGIAAAKIAIEASVAIMGTAEISRPPDAGAGNRPISITPSPPVPLALRTPLRI